MKKFIILLFLLSPSICFSAEIPVIPNLTLSPGLADNTVTKEMTCVDGYTAGTNATGNKVRNVSESEKKQVFAEYGLTGKEDKFEIDHIISLELGGSNNIKNLFPESYTTQPWNAHKKDKLENKLHKLVCTNQITLQEAQQEISNDWRKAYCKYYTDIDDCKNLK